MFRKAQSAMEYLMTYGWAILIILIAVGALFYLGVFSPKTPSVCQLEAPFVCKDMVINNNGILFEIAGTNINSGEVTDVKINGQSCSTLNGFLYNTNIQGETYTGCGVDLSNNKKVTGNININYNAKSGLSHSIEGEYSGSIEEGSIINIIEGSNNGIFNLNNNGLIFGWHGDSLNDYIGGLVGTPYGVTFLNIDGYLGSGAQFDGNDYIDYGNPLSLTTQGARTIAFWMKTTQTTGNKQVIGFSGISGSQGFAFVGTSPLLYLAPNNYRYWASMASYFDGNWHYITITMVGVAQPDISSATLRVDGNLMTASTTINTQTPLAWSYHTIGKGAYGYFNGIIDELHIWNRALSQEEIENLYSAMVVYQ